MHWLNLASRLHRRGIRIVLLGGPAETTRLQVLAGAVHDALGYVPRQSLFTHVNELALVAGLSPALVDRALPFVTVFNGSSDVDDTIAAPEVVAAFKKKSGTATDLFGGGMASASGAFADADPSAPPKSNLPKAKSPCYRLEAAITFKSGRRTASEVVIALGDASEPYRVLSWQNDIEIGAVIPQRRRF